jgi:hypothetical protein
MIFFFALVTLAAIVGSGTRKAAAISAVVSPQISRSASATCASRLSAGWQQVNTSRSRSSGMLSSSPAGASNSAWSAAAPGSISSGSLARSVLSLRIASSALRRAVVVSHAPGLAGTPERDQAASAET